jgi:hypothetical protein
VTVAELLHRLSSLPPDAVVCTTYGDDCLEPTSRVTDVDRMLPCDAQSNNLPDGTPYVVIF